MSKNKNIFPKNFFWGASTSAHQVEGGTVNQWSVWELGRASEAAKDAQKRLGWQPNWKDIKDAAQDPSNYVSGEGVDHYHRYKEDFSLAKQLNLNAFRFGIEWSRIEPEEGQWDEAVIEHYRHYIKELRAQGLEPFLNIWHWTNPIWFEDQGGFTKRSNVAYFERFVAKLTDSLLDDVTYVLTINEANNYVTFGYLVGIWPPGEKNPWKAAQVYRNLALAHKRAYTIMKTEKPALQISSAHAVACNLPGDRRNPFDWLVAKGADYIWHGWWYARTRRSHDFISVNFYFANYFHWFRLKNPKGTLSDMGWYMEPRRIFDVVEQVAEKYKLPVMVTETGVADADDQHRRWWLEEMIKALSKSLEKGTDVRGYLYWSLLDNFEWQEGWWPKFGLIEVDRERGMARKVRPSAKHYAQVIKKISAAD